MFGFHSPANRNPDSQEKAGDGSPAKEAERAGPSTDKLYAQRSKVRKSIGEWEAGKVDETTKSPTPPRRLIPAAPQKTKPKTTMPQEPRPATRRQSSEGVKYVNRLMEAKAMLVKAKMHLSNSRNLKTDIKMEVTQAVERLYQLVKEAEAEKGPDRREKPNKESENGVQAEVVVETEKIKLERHLLEKMTEHSSLIEKNRLEMERLREVIELKRKEIDAQATYASVAAASPRKQLPEHAAVHSVVITSADETETGDQIMDKIRKAVNAKDEGFQIDRMRKARDRKVILGCKTKTEVDRVREKIGRERADLRVEEVKNKDPLIIIKNVNKFNTEDDILKALRTQNKNLLKGVTEENYRAAIRYKKRARNPHQQHVVLSVSPQIWSILTAANCVHIDMQRLRAEDQSPLVQCSRCLGYGHSKKTCHEEDDSCAHCGGPHLRTECADYLAAVAPNCRNCQKAKMDSAEHNAFSSDCPVRRRWETLARSTVAYC